MKNEFVFQIEQDEDMLVATCHEPEMATQGENLDELLAMIRDLIRSRFDAGDERLAWPIRLHFLHDPVLSTHWLETAKITAPLPLTRPRRATPRATRPQSGTGGPR
jgi:predicted RNase H-like HicB family nuclease